MVKKDSTYQTFVEKNDNKLDKSTDLSNSQGMSSSLFSTATSQIASYTCIISDLTSTENTCRRHVINLSSSYTIDYLIQQAASFYSYDPFSFNLIWKHDGQSLNVTEIQTSSLNLADLGLNSGSKNIFEIHEKEGPPKRLKVDDFDYNTSNKIQNSSNGFGMDEEEWKPSSAETSLGPSRRNAVYSPTTAFQEYGPVNLSNNVSCCSPSVNVYEDEATGHVGLINQAMTCYLNSLLQTLYMTPEFRNGIYRWNHSQILSEQEDPKKSIPFQLQRLFLNLQTSNKKSIQTHDLTKSFGWNSDDAFQQHDVQELYRVMFDALEKKFKKTQQENLINELYQGKIKDYVKCLECNTESARVDVYLDVPLCIRPFGSDKTFESVEAALDDFIKPETLDENNKYYCEKCQRMCKAHKGLKFESFPYIISLQLKRFDFDYRTLSRFKIGSTVSFPEVLNVKKYLDSDKNVVENENQDSMYDYELFSIMIHSGSASGGHYYAYIKSFETNQWYNFNDERVNKIDKHDIIKAFGTSYSIYSSTTAYMLQYRQKNPQRNEKFIKVDEFDEHLKGLFTKEISEQLEADKVKEYMENMCKVKVIVPSMPAPNHYKSSSTETDNCSGGDDVNFIKKIEKTIDIHRDLTMEHAKEQIIKDLSLTDYLNMTNQKCRILKYDSYNDMIEQSYRNESQMSVFEALGFTKYPYNVSWFVEILAQDDEFLDYNSSDINIKILNLNMTSFEATDLFTIRLNSDSSVQELREQIAKKLSCKPQNIRMALEKLHTLYNYVYLNKNLNETLRSQNFTRVNKVFVEYEDETDLSKTFESSKFYYALDTIMNMLQLVIYLPIDEQCEIFLRKTKRQNDYIEVQRRLMETHSLKSDINVQNDENTIDSYDTVASEQTVSSVIGEVSQADSNKLDQTAMDAFKKFEENEDSSVSKMSYQENFKNEPLALVEDHFKSKQDHEHEDDYDYKHLKQENRVYLNEMETSLDEGIGGSSGSISTNNLNLKSSPNDLNWFNLKLRPCLDVNLGLSSFKSGEDINLDNNRSNYDDVADLDVNIDDNEINNLDDDLDNDILDAEDQRNNSEEQEQEQEILFRKETLDYNESCSFAITSSYPMTTSASLSTILSNRSNAHKSFKIKSNRVTFVSDKEDDDLNSKIDGSNPDNDRDSWLSEKKTYDSEYDKNIDEANHQTSDLNTDQDFDQLPKYSDINTENYSKNYENEYLKLNKSNERYIKSNLIVHQELGTRTLEIKMDKRIDLSEFKSHIDEYLNIGLDNFRVFRMCPNDLECELTSFENQFLYLAQNTKFVIKLGPPLKYGEYVLPVYKLNQSKGSFTYLCDFMIFHGLSVLNHKELLTEDLKDECNLEITVEKIRLRKKISKRPGNILLDSEVFGKDIFVNAMSELCIEILEDTEMKLCKSQISVYLRHWKPDDYELGDLEEIVLEGNTFDLLINYISQKSEITTENIEVLKCKRDFPFKSPILDLHRDLAWKENCFLPMEKLEDGVCFYYRDKTLKLGAISDEKRKEMEKEDNLNFRPTNNFVNIRKEIGIKIHVENS